MRLSGWRRAKLRLVMKLARLLGVPVDVHRDFWSAGKNDINTSRCFSGPK